MASAKSSLGQRLIAFLQEMPLPANVMASFFTQEALQEDRKLFLGFASVFAPAFPGISPDQELLLNASVYLGAKGIYQLDNVLDLQVQGDQRIDQAYRGQLFLLESQRILSQLFPLKDTFWQLYYQRLEKHFQELSLSKDTTQPLDEAAYLHLLEHKYALMYCPVDALFWLTGKKNQYAYGLIQHSLLWFSKGYNLPNEVMGVAEDLRLKINNYASWRLKACLHELNLNPDGYSEEDLHKLLYASGLAVTLLDEAIEALTKAMQLTAPLELMDYQRVVQHRIQSIKKIKKYFLQLSEEMC